MTRRTMTPDRMKSAARAANAPTVAPADLFGDAPRARVLARLVKHALDRAFAVVALAALSPLIALLLVAARLDRPGSVLARERRVGADDRPFDLLRFRLTERDTGL